MLLYVALRDIDFTYRLGLCAKKEMSQLPSELILKLGEELKLEALIVTMSTCKRWYQVLSPYLATIWKRTKNKRISLYLPQLLSNERYKYPSCRKHIAAIIECEPICLKWMTLGSSYALIPLLIDLVGKDEQLLKDLLDRSLASPINEGYLNRRELCAEAMKRGSVNALLLLSPYGLPLESFELLAHKAPKERHAELLNVLLHIQAPPHSYLEQVLQLGDYPWSRLPPGVVSTLKQHRVDCSNILHRERERCSAAHNGFLIYCAMSIAFMFLIGLEVLLRCYGWRVNTRDLERLFLTAPLIVVVLIGGIEIHLRRELRW